MKRGGWVAWTLGGLLSLLLLLTAVVTWVWLASEAHLRSFAPQAAFTTPIPDDAAAIARGEHLALTRGCGGCHGVDLAGQLMWDFALAPNLARYAREESAATFEAALRQAIGRDRRALYSMPSYNFLHLRDADVADLFAYLRSVPVVDKPLPQPRLPWLIRLDIALGLDSALPAVLDQVPPLRRLDDPDPRITRGEYLAMTTCNECHGFSLRADTPWDDSAPDLVIVMAYDEAAFRRLMREGIALGDRELEMMSGVARERFAHFTDREVEDLYTFLRDLGTRAAAGTD